MNFRDWKKKSWYPYTVATCSAVFLAFVLKHIALVGTFFAFVWKIVSPLVAGGIIAYIMDPVARFFENKVVIKGRRYKMKRNSAIAISCVLIFGGIFLLFAILTPSIIGSITSLMGNIDNYEQTVIEFLKRRGFESEKLAGSIEVVVAKLKEIVPVLTQNALDGSSQMSGTLANIGIGCILGVYFMIYKKRIMPWVSGFFRKAIDEEDYHKFIGFCERCNTILLKYLSCSLLDAVFIGVANAIFMIIFRIPNVALISVLVGVTNLAPTFGPLFGGAIGFIILALTSPGYGFLFLIFTCIIQTVDGYIVKPKIYGNSLGVASLWILIAIICGGKVFGVVGVLLAIPFAAIVQYLLEEILFPKVREEKNR
ncbi:MAG: AI-2E family transporter [Clostridia bacterium]|nr:AI-2E family transporter [Clostridia bacterium]